MPVAVFPIYPPLELFQTSNEISLLYDALAVMVPVDSDVEVGPLIVAVMTADVLNIALKVAVAVPCPEINRKQLLLDDHCTDEPTGKFSTV